MHYVFRLLLLRLQAGDECRSLDAAQRSLGALVAPTKDFFVFFFFLAEGVRNLYALSFLDKLFIEEQFTVHRNMCASHENEKKTGSRILRRFLEKKM